MWSSTVCLLACLPMSISGVCLKDAVFHILLFEILIALRFFRSYFIDVIATHSSCANSGCFCGHFWTWMVQPRCVLLRIRSRWCGTSDQRLRRRSTRTLRIAGCIFPWKSVGFGWLPHKGRFLLRQASFHVIWCFLFSWWCFSQNVTECFIIIISIKIRK